MLERQSEQQLELLLENWSELQSLALLLEHRSELQ
jgi:hypothetical protein